MSRLQTSNGAKAFARSARARPTTARGSPYGVPASLAVHALGVAAMLFVFHGVTPPAIESTMVPVELVVAETTNVAATTPEPQIIPQQEEEFVMPPPPEAVQPPLPDIPEPAPVEAKVPDIAIQKPPPPKPAPAPRNDINDLLNQLTKPDRTAKPAPRASEAVGASNMATASLADALRSQIRNCWSPMTGAPDPEDQIVSFALRLNRDGTVAGLEILSVRPNAYGAAAAEAASRAIYQCAPYRLPLDRYAQWREFRPLRFDPRQMMAR